MQPAVLLGFLGATVVAAVSSLPVDPRNHNEEMVAHCIIEVLSNALSKSNAPPITPECRQVLKKGEKEVKDEEKSANENTRFEVRLLRDPADTSGGREGAEAPAEEDTQGPPGAEMEGGGHSREGTGEPRGGLHPSDNQVAKEGKTRHSEKSQGQYREEEEGEKYQKRERGEEGSEERHLEEPAETQTAFLNRGNQATAKNKAEFASRYQTHSTAGPEKTHSRERSSQESGEETGSRDSGPREPGSPPEGPEEPEESQEDASLEVDKRRWRPRHHHGRSRPDRAPQEGSPPREDSEESVLGLAGLGGQRARQPTHHPASEEEPEAGEDVRSSPSARAPGDLEGARLGGRGGAGHGAARRPGEESPGQLGRMGPSSELRNTAPAHGEEREGERGRDGGERPHRARGGGPGAYAPPDPAEEEQFWGEARRHVPESRLDKERRHPQARLRNYLSRGEDGGDEGRWQQQDDLTGRNRADARLPGKQYAPRRSPEKKRLGEILSPYYIPAQWESSHFQRKDSVGDSFLEGEDENGLTLSEKAFFPEYSYEWWEKKPFEEDVHWGYEERNLAPKLDLKRQYDRVAELDQLLHYRKKSAESPDFYDSEERLSPHRAADSEKETAGQGVLTEEEEKELENLAAMDLELQKIAEKFSGNRRG
uniref:Secretogranin-1 n=1 Tax=Catagonus wagneri TaxID=51154 RepID=A0A8C3W9B8_9CETA